MQLSTNNFTVNAVTFGFIKKLESADSSFFMKPNVTALTVKLLVESCIMQGLFCLTSNWGFSAMTVKKIPLAGMMKMAIQQREPLSARPFLGRAYRHLSAER